jgi:hypothetical protein
MYDRPIRSELSESEGFLGLPSDTHRLAYPAWFEEADDFGNIEAGSGLFWTTSSFRFRRF